MCGFLKWGDLPTRAAPGQVLRSTSPLKSANAPRGSGFFLPGFTNVFFTI